MTLTDALACALNRHARTFSDGSWLLLFDDKGYPHPTVEKFSAAILHDPAFREALTVALAEALTGWTGPGYFPGTNDVTFIVNETRDAAPEFAAAIVAHLLPEADHA